MGNFMDTKSKLYRNIIETLDLGLRGSEVMLRDGSQKLPLFIRDITDPFVPYNVTLFLLTHHHTSYLPAIRTLVCQCLNYYNKLKNKE